MTLLTAPHEAALSLLFSEVTGAAAEQHEAFLGTPGTLSERANERGMQFWVHRHSDAVGRRLETYLGKAGDPDVVERIRTLRDRIDSANKTISQVRILARAGFATMDRKAYYTLASLHNQGLFRAGALLIGSHAYGAILNAMGMRAVAYATEDVDIARREALALSGLPPFLDMLRQTGIEFFEVPRVNHRHPSTSFAERGGSRLRVDLLVPSKGSDYPTINVPELQAHALGLPYLGYLLGASQEVAALSPHGAVLVRVPVPERYAVHKLIVSQLRGPTQDKSMKDLRQAAVLIDALVERFPGALQDALAAVPRSASRMVKIGAAALRKYLPESAEDAWEILGPLAARVRSKTS